MGGLGLAIEEAAYLALAAGTAGLAGVRLGRLVSHARRLLVAGYGHSAARSALALEAPHEDDPEQTHLSTVQRVAWIALGGGATAGSLLLARMSGLALPLLGVAGSVAVPTMVIRRLLESRGAARGIWSRLMRGLLGKAMFRAAGIGLGRDTPKLPVAGEPTSLALRNELTDLFAALPADQRKAFGELPDLAIRLERQAEALRDRTPSPETDGRLQSVLAALEMLRLDLLRLTAASTDTGDLTHDLDEARRVSEDIAARLEAHAEVYRLLRPDAPD
jgi:hypothetical protein